MANESNAFACVLEHYGLFKPEKSYKVVCPFHADLNPSMQIDLERGYWYCYGCGKHGGAYELVKGFEPKLNDLQIHHKIISLLKGPNRLVGKSFWLGNDIYPPGVKTNVNLEKVFLDQALDYYYNLPMPDWKNLEKWDPDGLPILQYMLNRGFSIHSLYKNKAKLTYNAYYPIVFPLLENGEFKGYIQRTNNKEVEINRKYLYNKGFKRKLTLAGTYTPNEPLVLVEGYLDCLAAKQLGLHNVAAILGWKLSQEQLAKLIANNIYILICALDNDEAGAKGYSYLKALAKSNNFIVKKVKYSKGFKDFGDLLKASSQGNSKPAEAVLTQIKNFEKVHLQR